jgi:hypothetical protein
MAAVVLVSAFGCASPKKEMPKGALSQAELTSFLIEMYVAEAHLDAITMPKDSAIKLLIPHEEKLKAKFAISDSTLKITYQYYLENPQELETVYDALIDSLSLKEQKTVKD